MKKFILIIVCAIILASCAKQTSQDHQKANKAYDIMVKAYEDNRDLTNKEKSSIVKTIMDSPVKDVDKDTRQLNRGIEAMYMNFYETLTDGEPTHFNMAKKTTEKYLD